MLSIACLTLLKPHQFVRKIYMSHGLAGVSKVTSNEEERCTYWLPPRQEAMPGAPG